MLDRLLGASALSTTVLLSAASAQAAIIDFTALPPGSVLSAGTVDGVGFSVTASGGALTNTQAFDGSLALIDRSDGTIASSLAFLSDGHGVGDDEISSSKNLIQSITVTFAQPVRILGFAFLDLFRKAGSPGLGEFATMTASGGEVVTLFATSGGASTVPFRGGYVETVGFAPIVATSVTFTVGAQNDQAGVADGALAALSVSALPIPLPAAGMLMVSGLLAIAGVSRRRSRDRRT